MNILIMGPAGSGKGTQSEKILEKFHVPHISTGDMFRKAIAEKTETGLVAQTYMNEGKLVPDSIVIDMIAERVKQPDCQLGYLIDGYPRTLPQAIAFEEITQTIGKPVDVVINLVVDFKVLKDRIIGRRVCRTCGAIFHTTNFPSKVAGICDHCNSVLVHRADDTEEQLKVRLEDYLNSTRAVLEFYREKGKVIDIMASREIDVVWPDIERVLTEFNK